MPEQGRKRKGAAKVKAEGKAPEKAPPVSTATLAAGASELIKPEVTESLEVTNAKRR